MKIANSNYPTDERVPWEDPLDIPGMMEDSGRCRDLERSLVTLAEFMSKLWSVTDTSRLLLACLRRVWVGSEEPRPIILGQ